MKITAWTNNGEEHVFNKVIKEKVVEDSDHFLCIGTSDNKSYIVNMNNVNCLEIVDKD